MDDKITQSAKTAYGTLLAMLDEKKVNYVKSEKDLSVDFRIDGDNGDMGIFIFIDVKRSLVRLFAQVPLRFDGNRRLDGAIATSLANYSLADGSFDFDYNTGRILFRMTSGFADSTLSKSVFEYMVAVTCYTVDEYMLKFSQLFNGKITLKNFS